MIYSKLADLQNDNGVLCRVLLQQVLEVWGAGTKDHLVGFCVLTLHNIYELCVQLNGKYLSCNGYIAEALLIPEVFEGGNHVGLEVIPAKAELLLISHGEMLLHFRLYNSAIGANTLSQMRILGRKDARN